MHENDENAKRHPTSRRVSLGNGEMFWQGKPPEVSLPRCFSLSSKYPWNSWFQFLVGQSSSWVRKQKPSGNINRIVLFRGSKISNYEQAMNKIMKTSQVKSKIWYLVLTYSHIQRSCSTLVVNLWSLCTLCRVRKQKDFFISASMSKFAGTYHTVLVPDIPWINKFELFPE